MVRVTEVLGGGEPLMERSFPKRKAEQIVTGLEQSINLQLLKLLGGEADAATRQQCKRELSTWLSSL